jgi:hypothetical protein
MGRETRDAKRIDLTKPPFVVKTQGVAKVTRKNADTAVKIHTFSSSKIDWITIYNAGDEEVAYNFNNNDATLSTHYRTLKPGAESHKIGITKDMTMEYKRLTGTGVNRIEITLWG